MEKRVELSSSKPLLELPYEAGLVRHPFPLNCLMMNWYLGSDFYQAVKIGIVQYVHRVEGQPQCGEGKHQLDSYHGKFQFQASKMKAKAQFHILLTIVPPLISQLSQTYPFPPLQSESCMIVNKQIMSQIYPDSVLFVNSYVKFLFHFYVRIVWEYILCALRNDYAG